MMLLTVFIGYLVFGFSENSKGPAIPRMQTDLGFDELQLGMLLAFNSLGYLAACSFTGLLTRRFGIRFTTLLAFGAMALSGVFIYLSYNYTTLAAAYFFLYLGNGALEIALSVLSARIFVRNTGMMMNLAHFFYGLSSIVAPIFASVLMDARPFGPALGWGGMYLIMMSLSLIPMIPTALSSFPGDDVKEAARSMTFKQYGQDPAAWLIVAILSLGVTAEMAFGGWLPNFMEKAYGWSGTASSGMLAAFFLCFTLSRLVLGPITDRLGLIRSLVVFSLFSGLCTLAAVVLGEQGAWLFMAAGAGIAPIYPTTMAYLAKRYAGSSDTAITFTVIMLGITGVIGNLLIGVITDAFKRLFAGFGGADIGLIRGLQAGFVFVALCALFCSLSAMLLQRHLQRRGEEV
ncbi:MFS transporter [Paenibacillus beijingensis]|uniref:MFS transporter n=1 Tax=Paenibacillus beijingensis TaxID=1126833 RepID=A0A0D5NQB3_9BACL|nr:MFS transporter [Paenibacillus beijingensis]AJY77514.1 MFS transporter [Paenibacillus beijingensis]